MNKQTEFDTYITPDGEEFNLNDWNGTWLLNADGYGMPPIDYKTSHGPFQHGETPIDFFLKPRVIQFQWRIQECGRVKYWELRNHTLDMLRPNRQVINSFETGVLRKTLSDGTIRDLNVLVQDGPSFPFSNKDWDEWGSINTLRFIAFDPVFLDPAIVELSVVLSALTHLVFPITFPIIFGSNTIDNTQAVTYPGTWLTYPVIVVTGPLSGLIVENQTTNERLEMSYSIPAGRVVTIDLSYGAKTVEDDLGANLIGTLSIDSDLATWHIAPDPEAPGGVNTIRVSGSSATHGQTEIDINYYTRYIGI